MAKGDPNPPKIYHYHRYRIVDVPDDCTDFTEGDFVDMYVLEPADQNIVINDGGACDGISATLDDPP